MKDIREEIGTEDASYKHALRTGRPQNDRQRLMKIICSKFDSKQKILQKARELRNNPLYNNVFINSDHTPLQQRKQRKQMGKNVKIHHGKIVTISDRTKNFQYVFLKPQSRAVPTISLSNARSIIAKTDEVRATLLNKKINILAGCETWLNSNVDDNVVRSSRIYRIS